MQDDPRPFGFWMATAYVIGGVIGAGIFVLPSQLAPLGWTSIPAWILGATGAVILAVVLASVTRARPQEPGLLAVMGEVLGPLWGTVIGWTTWITYWVANAYISLVSARYASTFWPAIGASPLNQALAASALLLFLSWLNLRNLKASGRFQIVTTLLKLLPLLAVMLIGTGLLLGDPAAFTRIPHAPLDGSRLLEATTLTMAAIIGFESASLAAQRVRDPGRTVPRATIIGVIVTGMIYILVCSTIVLTMPTETIAGSQAPIALFVGSHLGGWAQLAVAGFAVVSTVGCLSVWVLMQGEIPLSMVRAGLLPEFIARPNRHDIAAIPLLTGTACSVAVLLLTSWSLGAGVMDFMLRLTAVTGMQIYAFACVTALVLKVRPVFAVLGLIFVAGILYGGGAQAVLLGIALGVTCLPFYLTMRRARIRSAGSCAAAAGLPG